MSKISVCFGILLIMLGVGYFVGTGSTAKTALIPAYFGAVIAVSGALAMKPSLRAIFAHLALLVGVLGFLSGLGMGAKTWMQKGLTNSAIEQLLMGVICAGYVFLCIQSFRAARKARQG
jgi:hypothetical protein